MMFIPVTYAYTVCMAC